MQDVGLLIWRDQAGEPLTCHEKIKVLTENLAELQAMAQDVLEEALILGVDEAQTREVLANMIAELENPYA